MLPPRNFINSIMSKKATDEVDDLVAIYVARRYLLFKIMAERVGFEPTVPSRTRRFSRPLP